MEILDPTSLLASGDTHKEPRPSRVWRRGGGARRRRPKRGGGDRVLGVEATVPPLALHNKEKVLSRATARQRRGGLFCGGRFELHWGFDLDLSRRMAEPVPSSDDASNSDHANAEMEVEPALTEENRVKKAIHAYIHKDTMLQNTAIDSLMFGDVLDVMGEIFGRMDPEDAKNMEVVKFVLSLPVFIRQVQYAEYADNAPPIVQPPPPRSSTPNPVHDADLDYGATAPDIAAANMARMREEKELKDQVAEVRVYLSEQRNTKRVYSEHLREPLLVPVCGDSTGLVTVNGIDWARDVVQKEYPLTLPTLLPGSKALLRSTLGAEGHPNIICEYLTVRFVDLVAEPEGGKKRLLQKERQLSPDSDDFALMIGFMLFAMQDLATAYIGRNDGSPYSAKLMTVINGVWEGVDEGDVQRWADPMGKCSQRGYNTTPPFAWDKKWHFVCAYALLIAFGKTSLPKDGREGTRDKNEQEERADTMRKCLAVMQGDDESLKRAAESLQGEAATSNGCAAFRRLFETGPIFFVETAQCTGGVESGHIFDVPRLSPFRFRYSDSVDECECPKVCVMQIVEGPRLCDPLPPREYIDRLRRLTKGDQDPDPFNWDSAELAIVLKDAGIIGTSWDGRALRVKTTTESTTVNSVDASSFEMPSFVHIQTDQANTTTEPVPLEMQDLKLYLQHCRPTFEDGWKKMVETLLVRSTCVLPCIGSVDSNVFTIFMQEYHVDEPPFWFGADSTRTLAEMQDVLMRCDNFVEVLFDKDSPFQEFYTKVAAKSMAALCDLLHTNQEDYAPMMQMLNLELQEANSMLMRTLQRPSDCLRRAHEMSELEKYLRLVSETHQKTWELFPTLCLCTEECKNVFMKEFDTRDSFQYAADWNVPSLLHMRPFIEGIPSIVHTSNGADLDLERNESFRLAVVNILGWEERQIMALIDRAMRGKIDRDDVVRGLNHQLRLLRVERTSKVASIQTIPNLIERITHRAAMKPGEQSVAVELNEEMKQRIAELDTELANAKAELNTLKEQIISLREARADARRAADDITDNILSTWQSVDHKLRHLWMDVEASMRVVGMEMLLMCARAGDGDDKPFQARRRFLKGRSSIRVGAEQMRTAAYITACRGQTPADQTPSILSSPMIVVGDDQQIDGATSILNCLLLWNVPWFGRFFTSNSTDTTSRINRNCVFDLKSTGGTVGKKATLLSRISWPLHNFAMSWVEDRIPDRRADSVTGSPDTLSLVYNFDSNPSQRDAYNMALCRVLNAMNANCEEKNRYGAQIVNNGDERSTGFYEHNPFKIIPDNYIRGLSDSDKSTWKPIYRIKGCFKPFDFDMDDRNRFSICKDEDAFYANVSLWWILWMGHDMGNPHQNAGYFHVPLNPDQLTTNYEGNKFDCATYFLALNHFTGLWLGGAMPSQSSTFSAIQDQVQATLNRDPGLCGARKPNVARLISAVSLGTKIRQSDSAKSKEERYQAIKADDVQYVTVGHRRSVWFAMCMNIATITMNIPDGSLYPVGNSMSIGRLYVDRSGFVRKVTSAKSIQIERHIFDNSLAESVVAYMKEKDTRVFERAFQLLTHGWQKCIEDETSSWSWGGELPSKRWQEKYSCPYEPLWGMYVRLHHLRRKYADEVRRGLVGAETAVEVLHGFLLVHLQSHQFAMQESINKVVNVRAHRTAHAISLFALMNATTMASETESRLAYSPSLFATIREYFSMWFMDETHRKSVEFCHNEAEKHPLANDEVEEEYGLLPLVMKDYGGFFTLLLLEGRSDKEFEQAMAREFGSRSAEPIESHGEYNSDNYSDSDDQLQKEYKRERSKRVTNPLQPPQPMAPFDRQPGPFLRKGASIYNDALLGSAEGHSMFWIIFTRRFLKGCDLYPEDTTRITNAIRDEWFLNINGFREDRRAMQNHTLHYIDEKLVLPEEQKQLGFLAYLAAACVNLTHEYVPATWVHKHDIPCPQMPTLEEVQVYEAARSERVARTQYELLGGDVSDWSDSG